MTFRPEALYWLTLAVACEAAAALFDLSIETATVAMGALAIIFGARLFIGHGGRLMTATGIFALCTAAFAGFAGWEAVRSEYRNYSEWTYYALAACLVTLVLAWAIFIPDVDAPPPVARPAGGAQVTAWGVTAALLLIVGSLILNRVVPAAGRNPLIASAAIVGIVVLVTALWRRPVGGLGVLRVTMAVAAAAVFAVEVFRGGGRLTLVGLALSVAAVVMIRWRSRAQKWAMVLAAPLALVLLARDRATRVTAVRESDITGLESAVTPLIDMGVLMQMSHDRLIPLHWGETFLVSAVAHVPRELWPSKPPGFGAVLTPVFRPELRYTNHSELALFGGEMVWNFGWVGIVLMVPVLGLLLRWLDRLVVARLTGPVDTRSTLLKAAGVAIAIGGLVDLYWGGTFTYMSRGGARLLVLLGLWVAFARAMDRRVAVQQRRRQPRPVAARR